MGTGQGRGVAAAVLLALACVACAVACGARGVESGGAEGGAPEKLRAHGRSWRRFDRFDEGVVKEMMEAELDTERREELADRDLHTLWPTPVMVSSGRRLLGRADVAAVRELGGKEGRADVLAAAAEGHAAAAKLVERLGRTAVMLVAALRRRRGKALGDLASRLAHTELDEASELAPLKARVVSARLVVDTSHDLQPPRSASVSPSAWGGVAVLQSLLGESQSVISVSDPRHGAPAGGLPRWFQSDLPYRSTLSTSKVHLFPAYARASVWADRAGSAPASPRALVWFSVEVDAPEGWMTAEVDGGGGGGGCKAGGECSPPPDAPARWPNKQGSGKQPVVRLETFARWATPVLEVVSERARALCPRLRKALLRIRKRERSQRKSNKGGFRTRSRLFERTSDGGVFEELRAEAQQAVMVYLHRQRAHRLVKKPKVGAVCVDVEFSWGVVNRRGHLNAPHIHPGAHVSGVFYVDTGRDDPPDGPDSVPSIHFVDPRVTGLLPRGDGPSPAASTAAQFLTGRADSRPHTPMRAQAGKFIIFPAWAEHYVMPHSGSRERVAVSFNVRVLHSGDRMPFQPRRGKKPHPRLRSAPAEEAHRWLSTVFYVPAAAADDDDGEEGKVKRETGAPGEGGDDGDEDEEPREEGAGAAGAADEDS